MLRPSTRPCRSATAGFSVLELSLSFLILAGAAALALPAVRRSVNDRRRDETIADLRTFAGAFQAYAHDHGDWPAATYVPGAMPPGMDRYLALTSWTHGCSLGGRYEWLRRSPQAGGRYAAVIAIVSVPGDAVTTERAPLVGVDHGLDDGDLSAGMFFLGFHDYPVYVLEH